jgi:hypothetical protein
MTQLRVETGVPIVFEADWPAAANDEIARTMLYDAIRNAGTALFDLVRSGGGRQAVVNVLRRVQFRRTSEATVALAGDMLVVTFSLEKGLLGRPSSFAIRKQLRQILR